MSYRLSDLNRAWVLRDKGKMMSTIVATTSESHDFLVSGLRESQSQNAKTLDTIQEVRNGLMPFLTELRTLYSVDSELLLAPNSDIDMLLIGTRAQLSGTPNERTQQLPASVGSPYRSQDSKSVIKDRALHIGNSYTQKEEISSSQESLVQAYLTVEKVVMDVKEQQNHHARRNCTEQAQQFLQMQKGIEDIKGLFQTMKTETQGLNMEASSTLSLPKLSSSRRSHTFLPI